MEWKLDELFMPDAAQCPECGALVPASWPKGLCSACALRGALEPTASITGEPFDTQSRASVTEQPGERIGRYKLLEKIGEGGCGVVYMAEQEEPVRRRVALKVIKPGMDTHEVIARFEAERQALALMEHPHIAKVFDGGATDAGRPYFVMELVRGLRITDYCDQKNLSTRQRLDLFIQVCQAVQHAHQKGIIHRDLKPSNILVTVNDGAPVPKVIDFGIAKATGPALTDKTLFTRFQQLIGTPAYMSPEQAEMTSVDIDTRSDIYSLGVLLYELLTGRTPFDTKELLRAGMAEMLRTIREREPARPSACLSTLTAIEQTTVAQQRQTNAPKLINLVRGDLDWIVMKCLEKDRARRYETANGLATDVQRHLSNEPVTARPPTTTYRIGKFVRKYRTVVGAAAAFLLLLTVASVLSAVLALWANRERARLEETQGELSFVHFYLFGKLMGSAASPSGPLNGLGRDVTLRQAIERAEADLSTVGTNRPLAEARLRHLFGSAYFHMRDYSNAVTQLERTRALWNLHSSWRDPFDYGMLMSILEKTYERLGRSNDARALRAEIQARQRPLSAKETEAIEAEVKQLLEELRR